MQKPRAFALRFQRHYIFHIFLNAAILACVAFILAMSASHVEVACVMSSLAKCAPARCLISVCMMMASRVVPSWSRASRSSVNLQLDVWVGSCLLAHAVHLALGLVPHRGDIADVADGDLAPP